jgi:TM2 domain-containing membrane protein YozV
MLPLTICDLNRNEDYRLLVNGPGLESRIGILSIGRSANPSVKGIRFGASLRNGTIPGWGSIYAGRYSAGFTNLISFGSSLYVLLRENMEYYDLRDQIDLWTDRLNRTELLAEKRIYEQEVREATLDANVQNKHRRRLAILSAALYGYQMLDPWLFSMPPRAKTGANGVVVTVAESRATRLKAFLHSIIRPGAGQFYQGKNARGVIFSSLSVAAGLVALEFHNRYDVDVNRYNVAVDRFLAATQIDEKRELGDRAAIIWGNVEDARRDRNTAYIILASLWSWSLIDTMFPVDSNVSSARYTFDWRPGSCAFVMRF